MINEYYSRTLHSTKPQLTQPMLERASDAGVPCRWVTVEAVYGQDRLHKRHLKR
ncbi:hypothetical protein ABLB84_13165 [Xenorhabdus szentirmaii]|uniref:hypothetical protein n=1 Tax=Xenorhabdus szentirmaii TaxID=290112 RepID=UPI0032B79972